MSKHWRRFVFILLLSVVAGAAGLAGFYRWQFSAIRQKQQLLRPTRFDSRWNDYSGALHVHTRAGGHTDATLEEMLEGARAAGLDFIGLTEHSGAQSSPDTAAPAAPLILRGQEVDRAGSHELTFDGVDRSAFSIATHWKGSGIDNPAAEIFNLHEEADAASRWKLALGWLGSLRGYGQYLLMPHVSVYRDHLSDWQKLVSSRRVVAVAGNDAHANIGIRPSGRKLLLDPYERSFRYVSTHIWLEHGVALTRESLLAALTAGHAYIAFDFLAPTQSFYFAAAPVGGGQSTILSGDKVSNPVRLTVRSPLRARIVLIKDGVALQQVDALGLDFTTSEPGVYRVELYLRQLGGYAEEHPWIISNPVYVQVASDR
ncbi:MAG: hypothetical protein ACR2L2_17935 [Acidobacteriota bacterium]